MTLLSIFHTGGVTLALTLFWLIVGGILISQVLKQHKQEFGRNDPTGNWIKLGNHTPITAIKLFWMFIGLTILYVLAMIFVAIDYRGV